MSTKKLKASQALEVIESQVTAAAVLFYRAENLKREAEELLATASQLALSAGDTGKEALEYAVGIFGEDRGSSAFNMAKEFIDEETVRAAAEGSVDRSENADSVDDESSVTVPAGDSSKSEAVRSDTVLGVKIPPGAEADEVDQVLALGKKDGGDPSKTEEDNIFKNEKGRGRGAAGGSWRSRLYLAAFKEARDALPQAIPSVAPVAAPVQEIAAEVVDALSVDAPTDLSADVTEVVDDSQGTADTAEATEDDGVPAVEPSPEPVAAATVADAEEEDDSSDSESEDDTGFSVTIQDGADDSYADQQPLEVVGLQDDAVQVDGSDEELADTDEDQAESDAVAEPAPAPAPQKTPVTAGLSGPFDDLFGDDDVLSFLK